MVPTSPSAPLPTNYLCRSLQLPFKHARHSKTVTSRDPEIPPAVDAVLNFKSVSLQQTHGSSLQLRLPIEVTPMPLKWTLTSTLRCRRSCIFGENTRPMYDRLRLHEHGGWKTRSEQQMWIHRSTFIYYCQEPF